MPYHSGSIWLLGDCIRYEGSTDYVAWEVPIASVRVIGEETRAGLVDDWLFVVGTASHGWHTALVDAAGFDEFLVQLSAHLGAKLTLELVSVYDFADRVSWPPTHAGRPLYKFIPDENPSLCRRILLLSWKTYSKVLSDDVRALLESHPTQDSGPMIQD